jgi:YidC/Oxa1 family membrane protein insertase
MSFGGFTFIAVPLLKVLKFSYKMIPNYGVAIIVLTVLIKIILYPLDQKSYRSMKEMQKLQPLVAELRKKHKDDPRQAQIEQMKLFKEHKVNPLGGCLPMLLQMPVLIAMFSMIRTAIELRKAPFILWIKDLSAPDAVLNWGVQIPILGNTLNILPLLLVATFMLQTKISKAGTPSAQQDPQQKVMGHFMTVFFGIIFYNMPSGLNLYFAVSTVLRAIQQYFVQKQE